MPYMENAANARRNLTAPRNRIFEDVDTQQVFFAEQAALQAADKKSAISEEKAMRAQAVSEQALQAADLATVRYQLAPNFANHEAMQQSRAQQLEAVRNARRAAADAVLARADSERSKGRIPGAARHDSLFYFMPQIFPQPGTKVQRRRIRQIPLCSERLQRQPSFRRHRRTMHGYQAGRIPFSNRATSRPPRGIH